MAIHTNGCGQYSPPKTSPWPMPQYSERQRTCSQFQAFPTGVAAIPRMAMNTYSSKAFTMPHVQSTPLSSRSPSVASWCSFDTDYDEGLIIEEIKSDEEQLSDSDVEVLVGEYEDPPSDDEDYWERQRYRQQLNEVQEVILCGFEELSTASVSSPVTEILPSQRYCDSISSLVTSASAKRCFVDSGSEGDETDKEDNISNCRRRIRRRLTPHISPIVNDTQKPVTTQVIRGFTIRESTMEE